MDNKGKKPVVGVSSCFGGSSSSSNLFGSISKNGLGMLFQALSGDPMNVESERENVWDDKGVESEPDKKEKRLEKFYTRKHKQDLVGKVSKSDKEDKVTEPEQPRWNFRPRKPVQVPKAPKPNEASGSKATGKGIADKDQEEEEEREKNGKGKKKMSSANAPIVPKFSLTLTKAEIEQDFIAMTGQKPPRKPMKRSKTAQRSVDRQFPGMHLGFITKNDYAVPEDREKGE